MEPSCDFEIKFFEGALKRDPNWALVLEILASLYGDAGRREDSLRVDRKLVKLQPGNPTAHYNLGCSLALTQRQSDAIRALQRAIELGYCDSGWMRQDPDLKSLRQHPAFVELLAQIERNASEG